MEKLELYEILSDKDEIEMMLSYFKRLSKASYSDLYTVKLILTGALHQLEHFEDNYND